MPGSNAVPGADTVNSSAPATKSSAEGVPRSNGFDGFGGIRMEPLSTITATSPTSTLSTAASVVD
jgi:hypothetical protein